jgi:serine/threonine-protein kinase RsbW
MSDSESVKLQVPSRIEHLDVVQALAERLASLAGYEEEETLDLGLAVREGAINAMKHGHEFDPALSVRVCFSTDESHFVVSIRDLGEGFEPEDAPDPTSPENILRTSGRGLLLMRSLVDQIEFQRHAQGMELILTRALPRGDAAAGESP